MHQNIPAHRKSDVASENTCENTLITHKARHRPPLTQDPYKVAKAEPGEVPEEVDIKFGDSAYTNELPEKYADLDTTDITATITKQQEPLVISLTSE